MTDTCPDCKKLEINVVCCSAQEGKCIFKRWPKRGEGNPPLRWGQVRKACDPIKKKCEELLCGQDLRFIDEVLTHHMMAPVIAFTLLGSDKVVGT